MSCSGVKRIGFLEPANIVFIIAILTAIGFLVMMRRENRDLRSRIAVASGSLAGGPEAQPGDIVPPFDSVSLDSQAVEISFDGAKRLLYVFSPSCRECISQFPIWNRLALIAKGRALRVHGISIDGLEETRSQLKHTDNRFEVIIMPSQSIRRSYRVVSVPQVLLVSGNGTVEWVHYGPVEEVVKELVAIIQNLPSESSK